MVDLQAQEISSKDLGEALDMAGSLLSGISAVGIDLSGRKLDRAHFFGANMRRAVLNDASLIDANCCSANFWGGEFRRTVMTGANLRNAVLCYADLGDAVLAEAVFAGANLGAADLRTAHLEGAHLEGAVYDRETQFPEGFDPIARGMEFEGAM